MYSLNTIIFFAASLLNARNPLGASGISVPLTTRTTQLPRRCRSFLTTEKCAMSLVGLAPITISACRSNIGFTSFSISLPKYWLSASVFTITSAPKERLTSSPVMKAFASPLLCRCLSTWSTPHFFAISTVLSVLPSSIISHSTVSKPGTDLGSSESVTGKLDSSLKQGI